jgi:hypothetical protein
MNENEKRFVESIVNLEANVNKQLDYIKENYDIDGVFNEDDYTIKLECKNPENALMLAQAKAHIEAEIGEDFIRVVF